MQEQLESKLTAEAGLARAAKKNFEKGTFKQKCRFFKGPRTHVGGACQSVSMFELAVRTAWCVVLHCRRKNAFFSTALGLFSAWACCVVSLSGPSPLRSVSTLRLALLCA
jgi:hypothetical protein